MVGLYSKPSPAELRDKLPEGIYIKSSENMSEVEDETVTLVVTSPPYNVGKEYERGMTLEEWENLLFRVFSECDRVLIDGGRVCINIANVGRHPYEPRFCNIIRITEKIGWTMRGVIVWVKGGAGPQTTWGSWCKATNPVLRDSNEFILVFQKGKESIPEGESGITPSEFIEFTRSVWDFRPVTANEIGHPAPFPHELPRRCILLYSNIGDVVLDPFAGSCTTWAVAKYLKRKPIAYEINEDYIPYILERIKQPIRIQSEGWEIENEMRTKYPRLYNMKISELKRLAVKEYGLEVKRYESRMSIMKRIMELKKRQSGLHKFIS